MHSHPESTNVNPLLYEAMVQQAPEAIILADRGGLIRVWNRGAENVFGFSAAEALGNSLDMIIPERFREAHWRGFYMAIDSGRTRYSDKVLTTRSLHKERGRLYVDMSFSLIKDAAGEILGALAVARDATARRLEENALRARVADLEKKPGS
jgi:PAS domain S-box-containing protein